MFRGRIQGTDQTPNDMYLNFIYMVGSRLEQSINMSHNILKLNTLQEEPEFRKICFQISVQYRKLQAKDFAIIWSQNEKK